MGDSSKTQARRQVVNFTFFRVLPEWRRLSLNDRREHKDDALRILQRWENEDMRILTYSMGGLRADCDFLLWRICYSFDCLNAAHTDFLKTHLGGYLQVSHNFLGMTKRSQYLIGQEHENDPALRSYVKPGGGRYLALYPFTKTREWYHRPFEDRQRIVNEQIKTAQEFKHIRMNTIYSFGLDDHEYVIALESDHPEQFVDMAMRLREVENSMYMLHDTPRFTAVRTSPQEMLERLG